MKLFLIFFGIVFLLFIVLGIVSAMCISGNESRREERR